jgi:hypothetical protein
MGERIAHARKIVGRGAGHTAAPASSCS